MQLTGYFCDREVFKHFDNAVKAINCPAQDNTEVLSYNREMFHDIKKHQLMMDISTLSLDPLMPAIVVSTKLFTQLWHLHFSVQLWRSLWIPAGPTPVWMTACVYYWTETIAVNAGDGRDRTARHVRTNRSLFILLQLAIFTHRYKINWQ